MTNFAASNIRWSAEISRSPNHLGTVDVLEIDEGRSMVVYSTEIEPDGLASAFGPAISEAMQGLHDTLC
ncbi:SRPBCC family protein [Streptomyces flaveolus]|uniref:hypothetical protein n=1 Tax=Streptomyces flaveolus TaxID=67297 RepID=UPI0036FED44A